VDKGLALWITPIDCFKSPASLDHWVQHSKHLLDKISA